MKKMIISALCSLSFAFGGMDQWVESGETGVFRKETHFTAVGMSKISAEAAKNSAASEILKQISVTVSASEAAKESDLIGEKGRTNESSFKSRARLSSGGKIQGVEIIETSQRGGEWYALAALNKELFVKNCRAKITLLNSDLKKHYEAANRATTNTEAAAVITEIGEARRILREIAVVRTLLSAAAVLTEQDNPAVSGADLNGLYESVINAVSVKVVSGDRQEVVSGSVPAKPFVLEVSLYGQAVPFMPFTLIDSDGKEAARQSTDIRGELSFMPGPEAKMSRGTHHYKVVPAVVLTGNSAGRIAELTSKFSYTVIGEPRFAKIAVKLPAELESGRADLEKSVRLLLGKLDILHDSCACQSVTVSLSAAQGASVQGISASRSVMKSAVDLQISVSDQKGRELQSIKKSAKGSGSDLIRSAANGIENVSITAESKALRESLGSELNRADPAEKKKIAVFDFSNNSEINGWYETSSAITSMITAELINRGTFAVLERSQIDNIVKEKNFAGEDLDFAKLAGASYAVVGNASKVNGKIEIDARIIDMQSALAVGSASVSGDSYADLRALTANLVSQFKIDQKPQSSSSGSSSCCE